MTISTTSSKTIGLGNGITTSWNYSFLIPSAADLVVIYTDAYGVETTLSSSLYSVTGIGSSAGGSVTYPLTGSPIASGTTLTIMRVVPFEQTTRLSGQNSYYPDVVEAALDNVVMQTQQLDEINGRTLSFGPGVSLSGISLDLPAPAAGYALGWNSTGTGLTNVASLTGVSASAYVASIASSANAAAFLTGQGMSTYFQTLIGAASASALWALFQSGGVGGVLQIATATDVGGAGTTGGSFATMNSANVSFTPKRADSTIIVACLAGLNCSLPASPKVGAGQYQLYDVTSAGAVGYTQNAEASPSGGATLYNIPGILIGSKASWGTSAHSFQVQGKNIGTADGTITITAVNQFWLFLEYK